MSDVDLFDENEVLAPDSPYSSPSELEEAEPEIIGKGKQKLGTYKISSEKRKLNDTHSHSHGPKPKHMRMSGMCVCVCVCWGEGGCCVINKVPQKYFHAENCFVFCDSMYSVIAAFTLLIIDVIKEITDSTHSRGKNSSLTKTAM